MIFKAINALFPLYISNYSDSIYILYETSLATALILRTFVSLGIPGTYPFFILKEGKNDYKLYYLVIPLILNLIALVVLIWSKNNYYIMTALFLASLSLQALMSIHFQTKNLARYSPFFDTYHLLVYGLLVIVGCRNVDVFIRVQYLSLIPLTIFVIYVLLPKRLNWSTKDFLRVSQHGISVMLVSLAVVYCANFGRSQFINYLSADELKTYLIYFRLASFSVIFYQLFNYRYLPRIFLSSDFIFNRYVIGFPLFVTCLTAGFLFLLNLYSIEISFLTRGTIIKGHFDIVYFSSAIYFWVTGSIMELYMNKTGKGQWVGLFMLLLAFLFYIAIPAEMTRHMALLLHLLIMSLVLVPMVINYTKKTRRHGFAISFTLISLTTLCIGIFI